MSSDVLVDRDPSTRLIRKLGPLVGVRVLRVVLWLVVFTGPIAAGLGLVLVSDLAGRVDALSRQTGAEIPSDTGPVEGFAELFLAAYLMGSTEASPPGQSASDGERVVARTVSLGAEQIDVGYYAVTVAAVVQADDTTPVADALPEDSLVYRVGVVETGSGLAAVGPPALIPAPSTGPAPDLLVGRTDGLDTVAGLEEATVRFLAAYLTGEGELARYTAPGSQFAPVVLVSPPQCGVRRGRTALRFAPTRMRLGGDPAEVDQVVVVAGSFGDGIGVEGQARGADPGSAVAGYPPRPCPGIER